jgi:hypothetical protein
MSWFSDPVGTFKAITHTGNGPSGPPLPGAVRPPSTSPITSPINTGPQSPLGALPVAGSSQFTTAQQQAIQSAFSAAGIWDTIKGLGGDVWGVIAGLLPKNADGSIDWGGALKDVGSWVNNNKDTILQGLAAYNAYQRSQKSDEYANKAIEGLTKSYAAKEPLRVAGQAGLLNPQANTPDLSALSTAGQRGSSLTAPLPVAPNATNFTNAQQLAGPLSGNPFAKALPVAHAPTPTPIAPPLPAPPIPVAQIPSTPPITPSPTPAPLPVAPSVIPALNLPAGATQPSGYRKPMSGRIGTR